MYIKSAVISAIGFAAGVGVSAGTFAFLLVIRVLPRMIQKSGLEHKIIYMENVVIHGILFGTILSLYTWKKKWFFRILGRGVLVLFGTSAGIFVGCIAVALAEILDTFPIFFRRIKLKSVYVQPLIFAMALGKMAGSLFFFLAQYDTMIP